MPIAATGRHGGRTSEKAGKRDPKPKVSKPKIPKVERPKKLTKAEVRAAAEEMKKRADASVSHPHRTLDDWVDLVLRLIGAMHGHHT